MRLLMLPLLGPLLGSLLAACAVDPGCAPETGTPMLVAHLYFGRAVSARADVTDAEWDRFVDQVVVPALPAGFTMLDADGGWLNPRTGMTIREHSKVLVAAVPDTPGSIEALGRVRQAYASTFHQQLVGMTVQRACASF